MKNIIEAIMFIVSFAILIGVCGWAVHRMSKIDSSYNNVAEESIIEWIF